MALNILRIVYSIVYDLSGFMIKVPVVIVSAVSLEIPLNN